MLQATPTPKLTMVQLAGTWQAILSAIQHSGIWKKTVDQRVYEAQEFINEFGGSLSSSDRELILKNVNHLQRQDNSYGLQLK